jgi:putative transcriptional regulator
MKTSKAKRVSRRVRQDIESESPCEISAGSRILGAIEEATGLLRSEGLVSPRLTIRTYKTIPSPRSYQPEDVKRVRALLGTSQSVLARFLCVNVNTVRSWEQGKRPPQPIANRFLSEMEAAPSYWRQRIHEAAAEIESRKPTGGGIASE